MAKKLYVGGLPYRMDDEELRELFAAAGEVASASVVRDRMTGRSRGFGFVEMSTDEEANNAVSTINGKDVDGRMLTVNEARPLTDRPPRRDFGGGGGGRRDFGGDRRNDRGGYRNEY